MPKKKYTDEDLIKSIKGTDKEQNDALTWVCNQEKWNASVAKVVLYRGGTLTDVEDVFQESLAFLVRNIMQDKFNNNSTILTYFVSIAKFRYLKNYQNKTLSLSEVGELPEEEVLSMESIILEKEHTEEQKLIMRQVMSKLKERCQKILGWYSLKFSMEEIANRAGLKIQSAKTATMRCREKLRALIQEDSVIYAKIKKWL